MAVRTVVPVSSPLTHSLLTKLRDCGMVIDKARLERAVNGDPNARPTPAPAFIGRFPVRPRAKGGWESQIVNYEVWINLADPAMCFCTCQDYAMWGKDQNPKVPCKHILALAVDASPLFDALTAKPQAQTATPPPPPVPAGPAPRFQDVVSGLITKAVAKMADKVWQVWQTGEIPLLLGPTDCAKSGTYEYLAEKHGLLFFQDTGMESKADADLVGMLTVEGPLPKVFALAFKAAREQLLLPPSEQKPIILVLDELYRYNQRALDVLMGPLARPKSAKMAKLMGLPFDEPFRIIDVPIWPLEAAPARLVYFGLAANPWLMQPDPALIRRVLPIEVSFDPDVLAPFEKRIAEAVKVTWDANAAQSIRLPLGYSTLVKASHAGDTGIFAEYFARLKVLDPTTPDALKALFAQKNITL